MVTLEGQIWYSREISLCTPHTEATPSIEGVASVPPPCHTYQCTAELFSLVKLIPAVTAMATTTGRVYRTLVRVDNYSQRCQAAPAPSPSWRLLTHRLACPCQLSCKIYPQQMQCNVSIHILINHTLSFRCIDTGLWLWYLDLLCYALILDT